MLGLGSAIGYNLAVAGVVLFGLGTLFSFITLPVEYDASKRALAWLQRKNNEHLMQLLNHKVQSIEGVSRTETFISLHQQIDRQINI